MNIPTITSSIIKIAEFNSSETIGSKWELTKIPKIAHFYWGSMSLPYLRYMSIYSFCKLNPDWVVHMHAPDVVSVDAKWAVYNLDNFEYKGLDYKEELFKIPNLVINQVKFEFEKSQGMSEVQKSDYIRWALMSEIGGFWFDMDILFLKPVSELYFNKPENFGIDSLLCFDSRHHHAMLIGVLMSSGKNNRLYSDIFDQARIKQNSHDHFAFGIKLTKALGIESTTYSRLYSDCNTISLDLSAFYYHSYKGMDTVHNENKLQEYLENRAIGIHWFGGLIRSKELIAKINHKTYSENQDTLSNAISYVHSL